MYGPLPIDGLTVMGTMMILAGQPVTIDLLAELDCLGVTLDELEARATKVQQMYTPEEIAVAVNLYADYLTKLFDHDSPVVSGNARDLYDALRPREWV